VFYPLDVVLYTQFDGPDIGCMFKGCGYKYVGCYEIKVGALENSP